MKNPDLGLGSPLKFYDGTVTLRFSERDHAYYLENADGTLDLQNGVTQTCAILDKSLYLVPWAAKVTAEKILRTMPRDEDFSGVYTESIDWDLFEALVVEAKRAHKEKLVDAGDVGSAAHTWLDDSIKLALRRTNGIVQHMDEKIPNDKRAISCGNAAFDWMKWHNVRWIKTERVCYSKKYRYAGTMDGLALVDSCGIPLCCPREFKDELSIVDWKSSNNLRTEYLYQTAAYQHAEIEEFGQNVKARWILRLGKEDGKFEAWYLDETTIGSDFKAFELCLTLKRLHGTIEKRIAENKKAKTAAKRRK